MGKKSNENKKSPAKRANELDGKMWMKNSISIWSDLRRSKDEMKLEHPAIFPSLLAQRLIECYTNKDGRLILDPFAGIGSTLIAAKELGKNAVGIEISPKFAAIAERRIEQIIPYNGEINTTIHIADSRELSKFVSPNSIDLVITSPPYWDILLRKRTADNKEQRDYGDTKEDLGKISDYTEFLNELKKVFEQVYETMKLNSYCCVVVRDLHKGKNFYPYHMDVSLFMQDIGFTLSSMIIWDRRLDYNYRRPLGYPSVFYINTIHEFILIFQKQN